MAWITPVTNWTPQNYFNYTDWNRIESNCVVIAALLQICGYDVDMVTIVNRSDGSYLDFYDSLNRIEGNILALYNCYEVAPVEAWIAPVITWTYDLPFSYQDTNRMEGNELGLYNMLNGIIQEYTYCGQGFEICGLGWYN
ncbi:MAG: hypothetical protein P4L69_08945 [Desulfosporosinus sp.]|nr:hypothetical protein [Desulfosporosinus sp.]